MLEKYVGFREPWYPQTNFSFYGALLEGLPTIGRSSTCIEGKISQLEWHGFSTRKEDQKEKKKRKGLPS